MYNVHVTGYDVCTMYMSLRGQPRFVEWYVRFTTVSLQSLSDQEWMGYPCFYQYWFYLIVACLYIEVTCACIMYNVQGESKKTRDYRCFWQIFQNFCFVRILGIKIKKCDQKNWMRYYKKSAKISKWKSAVKVIKIY